MENQCYFVCSRGLLKSTTFHSPLPKSSYNNDYVYLIKMLSNNPVKMNDGMSIYVCSELLSFFVKRILPQITNTFILVTGDSDLITPIECLSNDQTSTLLNNIYLVKWFAQNTRLQNINKIYQLPIGLDYHTILNNPNHPWNNTNNNNNGVNHLPKQQEIELMNIRQKMKPFYERKCNIYINFSMYNDRFNSRKKVFEEIPNQLMEINQSFTKRIDVWNHMCNYTFILSPFGNGLDCHRTWEALCLGCIPIITASFFTKMFEDLPVLIVNEWSDITQELLDKTIIEFKNKTFNYDKLSLQYWTKQFTL